MSCVRADISYLSGSITRIREGIMTNDEIEFMAEVYNKMVAQLDFSAPFPQEVKIEMEFSLVIERPLRSGVLFGVNS